MSTIIKTYGNMLLSSLGNTLLLTLLALIFAMIIGLIFALMNVGKNRVFNFIGTVYVDAVRGVPLSVLTLADPQAVRAKTQVMTANTEANFFILYVSPLN